MLSLKNWSFKFWANYYDVESCMPACRGACEYYHDEVAYVLPDIRLDVERALFTISLSSLG